jgi:integrase
VGHRLRDIRPVHIQVLLHAAEEEHGTNLAHGTYKTMKVTLSAIFTEARNLGLYDGTNPTTGVRIPKGRKHGRKRLAYSFDEILRHLELFAEDPIIVPQRLPKRWKSNQLRRKRIAGELAPHTENIHLPKIRASTVRAIIGVTAFAGLRKGEIRGLWWDDDRIDTLSICRSVCNTTIKSMKKTSTIRGLFPSFVRCACF